mgnify:CR=1 FL=1
MREVVLEISEPWRGDMSLRYYPSVGAVYSRAVGRLYTGRGPGNGNWPRDIPPGRYRVTFEPIEKKP